MAHCITHDYRPTAISRHNLTGKQRNIRQSAVRVDYRIKSILNVPFCNRYFISKHDPNLEPISFTDTQVST